MPRGIAITSALHLTRFAVLLALGSAGTVATAAQAPAYPVLLKQSLTRAPSLTEQAAWSRAAYADAQQARAWLNPSIEVLSENLDAPASGGVSQRQDTWSITQPIEIGGRRAARIEAGDRAVDVAQARDRETRIRFAAQLAVLYATAEAMQARLALAQEDLKRAGDDLNASRALVKAGKEAALRTAQAQASVAAAEAAEAAARADLTEALEQLSALVGLDEPYSSVPDSLLTQSGPADAVHGQGEAPAVLTARAEREAAVARVRVEQKQRLPTLGVSAGVRRFAWSRNRGWVVGLSATIPLFDHNTSGIAAARERETAAESRLAAVRLEAQAARRSATAQAEATEKRLTAAAQGESAATDAYRLARIGYEAGKTSLVELLVIRRALYDAKLSTIDARLARIRALAALSQADGRLAFGD